MPHQQWIDNKTLVIEIIGPDQVADSHWLIAPASSEAAHNARRLERGRRSGATIAATPGNLPTGESRSYAPPASPSAPAGYSGSALQHNAATHAPNSPG